MQVTQETQVWSLGQEDLCGVGNGNPLQNSCLENSMDRGAWRATVHGLANSQTWLSTQYSQARKYGMEIQDVSHLHIYHH